MFVLLSLEDLMFLLKSATTIEMKKGLEHGGLRPRDLLLAGFMADAADLVAQRFSILTDWDAPLRNCTYETNHVIYWRIGFL